MNKPLQAIEINLVPEAYCEVHLFLDQYGPLGWYRTAMRVLELTPGEDTFDICAEHYDSYRRFMEEAE